MAPAEENGRPAEDPLAARIGEAAERKLRARGRRRRSAWFGLSLFGLVGWAIALPTLAGAFIGAWIDSAAGTQRSWTLALILAGLVLGCANAWFWVQKESRHDD